METALADPLAGVVLDGRYRVEAVVARGGMSTVYSAVDLRLDRLVAVKVMSPALAHDPVFVDRFAREARAAARLSHPNAVAVFDQGADAGRVFLVMELVRGRTLRDLLAERGRLSAEEAVSVLEPVLAALAAAHRAGLVHRDVKPENVLVSEDGTVKVADFGLARAVAATTSTSQTGVVFGTVSYVAPEQVTRGWVDPRTDVYAAGILLYELLTGAPPYVAESAIAVAYRHVHDDVPPPSGAAPGVSPALDELVLRATRREPGARPVDAGAMLAELSDVRADLGLRRVPLSVRPASAAGHRPADRVDVDRAAAAQWERSGQAGRAGPAALLGAQLPVGGAVVPPATESGSPPARRLRDAAGDGSFGRQPGRPGPAPHLRPPEFAVTTVPNSPAGALARRAATAALPAYPLPASTLGRRPGRRVTPPQWPDEQRAQRRRLLVGIGSILVLAVLAAGAGWWYGSGRYVEVPRLVSMTTQQASAAAESAHLRVRLGGTASSDSVPVGDVLRTRPGAGDRVRRGSLVTLVTSGGPAPVAVPSVEGMARDAAVQALSKAGLRHRETRQFSTEVPTGSVVAQRPKGGTVPKGSTVSLVVSKGPDLVDVPGVLRWSVEDAVRRLENRGFQVEVHKIFGGAFGRVLRQSPGAGEQAPRGATVTLDVI